MKYWDKHKSKLTHERYAVNGIGSYLNFVSCFAFSRLRMNSQAKS